MELCDLSVLGCGFQNPSYGGRSLLIPRSRRGSGWRRWKVSRVHHLVSRLHRHLGSYELLMLLLQEGKHSIEALLLCTACLSVLFFATFLLDSLSLLQLVNFASVDKKSVKVYEIEIMSTNLCSFISFHSLKAPLMPNAAMPTAAASWTQAFVCFLRASAGDISPS